MIFTKDLVEEKTNDYMSFINCRSHMVPSKEMKEGSARQKPPCSDEVFDKKPRRIVHLSFSWR